jgi:hypothetical protein
VSEALRVGETRDLDGEGEATDPTRPSPARAPSQGRGSRRARWIRTGAAIAYRTGANGIGGSVGWSWEIRRDRSESRRVEVEVSPGPYRVTDLPAEARNAIRSRGATAVDAFLDDEDPPARILVSTRGVHAHGAQSGA